MSMASGETPRNPAYDDPHARPVADPSRGSMPGGVLGVGIDVVAVARFAAAMERTPGLVDRLLTPDEQFTLSGSRRSPASLAARFAVKEAVAKALGAPRGMLWHDCVVVPAESGRPTLRVTGTVAAAAQARGVAGWEISLTHDGGIASAIVIATG